MPPRTPRPVPGDDSSRSPWGKRIGIAAAAVVAIVIGLVGLGALVGDPDGQPTAGPTVDPTFGQTRGPTANPTAGPTEDGDPFAWLDALPAGAWVATTAAEPIVVDGSFDDWPEDLVAIGIDHVIHGEPEGVGGQGVVAWDDDVLYVGAIVDDPFVEQAWHTQPSQLWRGDSVSLEFAIDPPDDPAATIADGDLHVLLGPDDGGGDGVLPAVNAAEGGVFRAGGVEPAIELVSVLTDTGYAIEAAIPWVVFGFAPEVGESVGFNLNISNGDGAGDFSSMVSSTEGRTSANQPRAACWGRLLMWADDLTVEPSEEELPRPSDAVPC